MYSYIMLLLFYIVVKYIEIKMVLLLLYIFNTKRNSNEVKS